jgi:predicted MPP superfamily phosphohydrolase
LLGRRLRRKADHVAELVHQGEGILRLEEYIDVDALLTFLLKSFAVYRQGHRNYLNVRIVHNEFRIAGLPAALEGFRILQLSDLHLDLDLSLTPILEKLLERCDYDLAVLTGDYRNCTREDFRLSVEETAKVLAMLKPPAYGILGNHDFIEMAPELESAGLRLLLNESQIVPCRGACLFLAGIDDPHFYRTHDIARASQGKPNDVLSILLSHSPETYREAEAAGYQVILSGHTHGGQICLPGGIALVHAGNCPYRMSVGPWRFRNLQGYTSPGTGATGVPVRFFCPPEVTIHTLCKDAR